MKKILRAIIIALITIISTNITLMMFALLMKSIENMPLWLAVIIGVTSIMYCTYRSE